MNGPEDESQEDELEDDLEADDNAALLDEEEARLRYIIWIQLNEYETAPYFIQFSRNLTSDCLLISVLYPEFTWAEPWNYFEHQNKTMIENLKWVTFFYIHFVLEAMLWLRIAHKGTVHT